MATTPNAISKAITLGGCSVNAQITEGGGSADIVFTCGESPDQEFFRHLKQAADGYRRTLMNDGYRVLTSINDHAIKMQIGDVSPTRLEMIAKDLENEMQLAWNRKAMAQAATATQDSS